MSLDLLLGLGVPGRREQSTDVAFASRAGAGALSYTGLLRILPRQEVGVGSRRHLGTWL